MNELSGVPPIRRIALVGPAVALIGYLALVYANRMRYQCGDPNLGVEGCGIWKLTQLGALGIVVVGLAVMGIWMLRYVLALRAYREAVDADAASGS